MDLHTKKDIEDSKGDAKELHKKIRDKLKKDEIKDAIIGWLVFFLFSGLCGVGGWIVILIIKALSKYVSG